MLKEASELGPVCGIFNLAVALRDGLFDNQTAKLFEESFEPKAVATKHLDELSRVMCPALEHFVIFSSVSCGRGNPGQSNYGMANSIMERIVEKRRELKLPAKAIQWGAIGDVGLLAQLQETNMDMKISGTLPQKITSCLEILDKLLTCDEAIVSSMVVAAKQFTEFRRDNIIEALCNILGIRDRKTISMEMPLSKLGMDSLMTIEVIQLLEREFNLIIPLKELQTMTLYELEQRTKSKDATGKNKDERKKLGVELVFSYISIEPKSDEVIIRLNNREETGQPKVLILPGIEGTSNQIWENFSERLASQAFLLQFGLSYKAQSIKELHDCIIEVSEITFENYQT